MSDEKLVNAAEDDRSGKFVVVWGDLRWEGHERTHEEALQAAVRSSGIAKQIMRLMHQYGYLRRGGEMPAPISFAPAATVTRLVGDGTSDERILPVFNAVAAAVSTEEFPREYREQAAEWGSVLGP
jgi:hypothetical protein